MKKKVIDKRIIIFMLVFLVLFGKFIRYSFMKDVLVNQGVGHSMISIINNGTAKFGILSSASDALQSTSDNASKFFSLINFFNIKTYEGFEIYITIIWNLILLFIIARIKNKLALNQIIFIILSIIVLNIFDFCLAKEPVQMLFFIAIFGVLISEKLTDKKKFITSIIILLLCSIFYRTYYVLIAFFFVYVTFIFKYFTKNNKKVTFWRVLFLIICTSFVFFLILNISKIIAPTQFEELLRVRLRTSNAASDIRSLFKSTTLSIFSIDYIIILIRMLFPIELLRLGIKYLPYVIYQLMVSYVLIINIKQIKFFESSRKYALLLFIAFTLGSATFEPDFGSWIRHEAVLFPIMLIIMGVIEKRKQKNEK